MHQILESKQTPHNSPSRASYAASIVRIWEKIDRVITVPHCIYFYLNSNNLIKRYDKDPSKTTKIRNLVRRMPDVTQFEG